MFNCRLRHYERPIAKATLAAFHYRILFFSAILAATPMGWVAWRLWGVSAAGYAGLAPLLTLFFFRRSTGASGLKASAVTAARKRIPPLFWLLPGSAFVTVGLLLGRTSLVWIGSYWNLLAVFNLHGVGFVFPAPLLIFAVPPLSPLASVIAGYSVRLWLSGIAADLLQFVDPAAIARGNIITFRGEDAIVERLCEGTKMAAVSVLLAIVFARFSSQTGRRLILAGVAPLWLGTNLLRIVSLILFRVPAGTPGHELVGLAFFLGMILFPMLVISLAFPNTPAEERLRSLLYQPLTPPLRSHGGSNHSLRNTAMIIAAALAIFTLMAPVPHRPAEFWPASIQDFARRTGDGDPSVATFLRGDTSLILKDNLFAPGTAHDPRICFEAAGFTFREESEEIIGTFRVRSALVEKNGKPARLFWWYAWEQKRSSSDVEWRLARLTGKAVFQINLYGPDDPSLRESARRLLHLPYFFDRSTL